MIRAHRKFSVPLPAGLLEAMGAAQAAGGAGNTPQIGDLITSLTGDKEAGQQIDELVAGLNGGHGSGKKHHGAKPGGANVTGTSSSAPSAGTGVTSSGSLAANASGAGVVTATPEQGDIEYLAPVTIGGQTINMDFDSGSSDLWVFNTQLSAKTLSGHTVYDPQQSKDFQVLQGASYTISYGDGSGCAGNVGTDTVNIGGVSVTSQAVELPTAVSASFIQDTQSNGLVGLAFSNINTVKPTQQKTFFDNAIPSLPEPVFTADLRANAVGAYEFGNIDTSKFNGSLSWASINNTSGFWQFSSEKFVVAGGAPMTVAGGQAIADTGTTLMLVNSAVVNAYYSKVQGAVNNDTVGGVTFPCDSDLPDLQIDIGGNLANVRGDDINFSPVDATGTSTSIHARI